jgi:TRAP-type uncharacterized transport system substrate-binding protein
MKKMISLISAVLVMFAFSSPITSIAKSAEFFTIGTGGPTGVYFQTETLYVICYTNQQ